MGKTQLALEYFHQSYKDYKSVFWINASSEETTILGFTRIMQQLIKYYARVVRRLQSNGRASGFEKVKFPCQQNSPRYNGRPILCTYFRLDRPVQKG